MTTAVETTFSLVKNVSCPCEYTAIIQLLDRAIILYALYREGRETNEIKWLIISTTVFVAKQQSFMLRHTDVVSANCLVHFGRSTTFPMSGPLTGEVDSKIADKVCINQGCASYKPIP
jgi:hypothetical protein